MAHVSHTQPLKQQFSWIKQQLDPQWSYIVIEHEILGDEPSLFDPEQLGYAHLEAAELTFQQIIDTDRSREYLMIRIPPEREDDRLGRIMGAGFAGNMVYYLFKAEETMP